MSWLDDAAAAIKRQRKVQEQKPLKTGSTRPLMGCVSIRARDDLDPTTNDFALPKEYRLTSATDLIGVVEIVDVGQPLYDKHGRSAELPWKSGDIAMVSMADVRQQFVLEGSEYFMTNADSLFARLSKDNKATANLDWIITKRAPERMTKAVTGQNRLILPDNILSDGIPSGEITFGRCAECQSMVAVDIYGKPAPATYVVYEEIVDVGPGRNVLGIVRPVDYEKGALIMFSVDFAIPFELAGMKCRAVLNGHTLGEICGC